MRSVLTALAVSFWFLAAQPGEELPQPDPIRSQRDPNAAYAQAKLQLAEANLERVQRLNERVSNAVPADVVNDCRRDVQLAQERLAAVKAGRDEEFSLWQAEAQRTWKSAEAAWKSAAAANQRQAGAVPAVDVERLRLRAEVYRTNFERSSELAAAPRDAQLAWRASFLNDQVEQLTETVLRGSPARTSRPIGDYRYWDYHYYPGWR